MSDQVKDNTNTLRLLSPRILELAPAEGDSGSYKLVRPSFQGFGSDEWRLRSHYEQMLTGYRHDRVRILGQEGAFLGLVHTDDPKVCAYVEIDDLANPIRVSEKGLVAVYNTESLLGSQSLDRSHLDETVKEAKDEKVPLRMAIFRRLYEHYNAQQDAVYPLLFELLPWLEVFPDEFLEERDERGRKKPNPLFRPRESLKAWLIVVARHLRPGTKYFNPNEAKDLAGKVPWLDSNFDFVEGGFAYQLTRVANGLRSYINVLAQPEELEDEFKTLTEKVLDLVLEFRRTRRELVPKDFRGLFVSIPDTLTAFLNAVGSKMLQDDRLERIAFDKWQLLKFEQALLAFDVKIGTKYDDRRQRLRNLAEAILVADRARFFERWPEHLNELIKKLPPVIAEISDKQPKELLLDPRDRSLAEEGVQFNALINSADLMRVWAKFQFLGDANRHVLSELLDKSLDYYEYAERLRPQLTNKERVMLRGGYTSALLLKAETAVDDEAALRKTLDRTAYIAAKLGGTSFADRLFQTKIGVERDRYLPDEAAVNEIVERLKNLIQDQPDNPGPYELLFRVFSRRGDFERALSALKTQLSEARSSRRRTGGFEYRIASFCLRTYEDTKDPDVAERAIDAYGSVLKNQATNVKAASELISLFNRLPEREQSKAKTRLEGYLSGTDSPNCPVLHAMLRLVLSLSLVKIPSKIESEGDALVVLVQGPENLQQEAENRILAMRGKLPRFVFECISKEYFERGRLDPGGPDFKVSERFIQVFSKHRELAKQPPDVVVLTRKAKIERAREEFDKASETIETLERLFPDDPIVRLEKLMLQKRMGNIERVRRILREEADSSHPAFRDQEARLALWEGDVDRAQKICGELLSENKFDIYAITLQARIYLEAGEESWPDAVRQWLHALRLRAVSEDPKSRMLAIRTARSIAGVCQLRGRNGRILNALLVALETEHPLVIGFLLEALSELAVVDEEVVRRLRETLDHIYDRTILRKLAQLLTVRNIYLGLGIETATDMQRELLNHVRWCREKGVLPEYLAGSKGAYGRALMKRLTQHSDHDVRTILNDLQRAQPVDADWQILYGHIVEASRGQTDYYRKAYDLSRTLVQKKDEEWVSFSRKIVTAMLGKTLTEEDSRDPKTFLREEPEKIAEWELIKLGIRLKNDKKGVGGWVDRDALAIFEQTFNHQPEWHLAPEEFTVRRRVEDSAKQDAHLYGKFGIRIKTESHSRICYACIDTFDSLRTSTEDYADAVISTEETEVPSSE